MNKTIPGISYAVDFASSVGPPEPIPEGSIRAHGFCDVCGIIRTDQDRVPVTDCVCTARMRHDEKCRYVKAVSMWISVGGCETHGLDACEECDCDCGRVPEVDQSAVVPK